MGGQVTAGNVIGAIGGAAIGFLVGGPAGAFYGAMVGYGIGGMIDPAKTPEQPIDTEDLQFNTFQRNLPVPIVYGENKVFGNVIWIGNVRARTREEPSAGGKGGGGPTSTYVEYFADFAVAVSEGEIQEFVRAYIEDKDATANEGLFWRKYYGTETQEADISVSDAIPTNTPVWMNTAYMVWTGSLGQINRIPNISAVIVGIEGFIPGDVDLTGDWAIYQPTPIGTVNALLLCPTVILDPVLGTVTEIWATSYDITGDWKTYYLKWTTETGVWTEIYVSLHPSLPGLINKNNINLWPYGDYYFLQSPYRKIQFTEDFVSFTEYDPTHVSVGPVISINIVDSYGQPAKFIWMEDKFETSYGRANQIVIPGETPLEFNPTGRTGLNVLGGGSVAEIPGNPSTGKAGFFCDDIATSTVFYIYYSENASVYAEFDFSSEGTFNKQFDWLHPVLNGETGQDFFFTAERVSDGYQYIYTLSFGGTLTRHAQITISYPATITGMFWKFSKLFLSTNETGKEFGYFELSTGIITWLPPNSPTTWTVFGPLIHDGSNFQALRGTIAGTYNDWRLEGAIVNATNSPAVSIWDFLTNTRYGMGIPEDKLDKDSFFEVHDYCNEIVDGIVRYSLDIVLGSHKSALDHLVMMLQSFGGFIVWSEGVIKLKVDKLESSLSSIGEDDIIADSFQYSYPSLKDIPNRIKADFRDRDDEFRHNIVFANDEYDQEVTNEIREMVIQLLGVTRKAQASRLAQYYIDNAIINRLILTFRISIKHISFEVGDVIDVTHSLPGWIGKLFRIIEISEQDDDELAITCREYSSDIYHDEGVATQVNTDSYIPSMFDPPEHVVHLDAYEKTETPTIKITFGILDNPGWWSSAQIFKSVGDNSNHEFIGDSVDISDVGLLESALTDNATTIHIKEIYGSFPALGTIFIEDEEIAYTEFVDDGDDTGSFTGCSRGQNNTVAASHDSDLVVTLNAVSFEYSYNEIEEMHQTVYFKALSISPKGVNATPAANAPETTIVPVGRYKRMLAVDGLEINWQGNIQVLPDNVDCSITWNPTNRYIGYGKMKYGENELGYGGGGIEESFIDFQVEIVNILGVVLRRVNIANDAWVYTLAMRVEDGTDISANFTIKVYQKSTWSLSEAATITVNS